MDIFDGIILIGLGLVVAGVALWSVPAALVVAGVGLVLFGLIGARRKTLISSQRVGLVADNVGPTPTEVGRK